MSVLTSRPQSTAADPTEPSVMVPTLENGDRLTRAEFERRYEAMPNLKKAELIEGEVYVGSPVRHRQHGKPHNHINGWLAVYVAGTPGVEASDNGSIRLDLDNEPQPDAYQMIERERGGQARIDEEDYVEGAPELVAEIAASSVSYDLGKKLHVYRRNGVREYVVWRVQDRAIDWFVLREGRYEPVVPADDGIIRSTVFAGLWLDLAALLRGDLATVLAVVQRGLTLRSTRTSSSACGGHEKPDRERFTPGLSARKKAFDSALHQASKVRALRGRSPDYRDALFGRSPDGAGSYKTRLRKHHGFVQRSVGVGPAQSSRWISRDRTSPRSRVSPGLRTTRSITTPKPLLAASSPTALAEYSWPGTSPS